MSVNERPYDLLGIGFGPSNLSLAISLAEAAETGRGRLAHLFLEQQPDFAWHRDMLLPGSSLQISFIKDLVSLRDPTSPYSFMNYLHANGRLARFANRKTFFPSRQEFNDYLRWVASHFENHCAYGEKVVAVEPELADGEVIRLAVTSEDAAGERRTRRANNLVVGGGGRPAIPDSFSEAADDARVIHSSQYLRAIESLRQTGGDPQRVAVIGSGQSAAEIFMDLAERFPSSRNDLLFRSHALKPSDDSPFVNEIFDPEFVDTLYQRPSEARWEFLRIFRDTNYGVVDLELIERIYQLLYEQEVEGIEGHAVHPLTEITDVANDAEGLWLTRRDRIHGTQQPYRYDAVILATGYELDPLNHVLSGVRDWIADGQVDRYYRLPCKPGFHPTIFEQGYNELTHGLSNTLLSVLAMRSEEITEALLVQAPSQEATRPMLQRASM